MSATEPPPKTAPLIFLGDSHAMGWGVFDEHIFTAQIDNSKYVPYNLAVSSYGTVRELQRLDKFA